MSFATGATVVRRDVFRGKPTSAWPCRAIHDTGDQLVIACLPRTEILSSTTSIEFHRTGDRAVRARGPRQLHDERWELGRTVIGRGGGTILGILTPDTYFSVLLFLQPDGALGHWYVNFERPYRRTAIGVDTRDLALDLVVQPDGSYAWKDEAEYAEHRRLGLIDDTDHAQVQAARDRVLGARVGPFAERWLEWRVDPSWPTPVLPPDAATLRSAY